jgi:acetyl-CoA carboxylase biotin carboxyl carrier protein
MNQKELKDLIELLVEKDITEFELERGDVKVRVKRGAATAAGEARFIAVQSAGPSIAETASPVPAGGVSAAPGVPAAPEAGEAGLHTINSPIVGTFYEAPSPGSPPFVKPGDIVEAGQVLCLVEAMKLMNEIESDVAGEVVKKFASNGQPLEYGQALFAVRPRA